MYLDVRCEDTNDHACLANIMEVGAERNQVPALGDNLYMVRNQPDSVLLSYRS